MSMMTRFKDIMTSNINALLEKAENPKDMINQYLRNLNRDLGKVKAEIATVMVEEERSKRMLYECQHDMDKMERYAKKALEAGSDEDARKFLEKKATLEMRLLELQASYELATSNTFQMKQMHDKLIKDIEELVSRSKLLQTKWTAAKTQERINNAFVSSDNWDPSTSSFEQMEEKVDRALFETNAMAELLGEKQCDFTDLTIKMNKTKSDVESELAALKKSLKKNE